MTQLTQINRYVTSWLGWTPEATATFDIYLSSKNDDASTQESSGFYTVIALYLAMAIVLAAVSFLTGNGKATSRPRKKRKLAQQQQQTPWCYSATGLALTKLIRQLDRPKRSRHQQSLYLRMRLRRHLEQELKLIGELQEKGPELGLLDWQDAEDAEETNTYFDLPSEAEQ